MSLEAVLPKDRYGVRTCKLKTNGDTGPSAFTTLCSKLHVIEFQVVYKCEEDFPGPFPAVNSPSRFLNPDSLKCKPHCLQSHIEKAKVLGLQPRKGQQRVEIYWRVYIMWKGVSIQSSVSSSTCKISIMISIVNICPISSPSF